MFESKENRPEPPTFPVPEGPEQPGNVKGILILFASMLVVMLAIWGIPKLVNTVGELTEPTTTTSGLNLHYNPITHISTTKTTTTTTSTTVPPMPTEEAQENN